MNRFDPILRKSYCSNIYTIVSFLHLIIEEFFKTIVLSKDTLNIRK